MLTFFRRIRKALLDGGATGKYLVYAVGEILLVMVGILLALQVNNWNEWRKDKIKERAFLAHLHEEFIENKSALRRVVSGNREVLKNLTDLIALFPIDPHTLDQGTLKDCQLLLKTFGIAHTFNPSNAIINAITNNNSFDLITDDTLRLRLLSWHSVLDEYLDDERSNLKHSEEQIRPYLDGKGISTKDGLFDDRFDISFLGTLEFEGLIGRKHIRLTRIYGTTDDSSMPDLRSLHNSIEEIIRLTKSE